MSALPSPTSLIDSDASEEGEVYSYCAVLGSCSSDHLYRGVASPQPIGLVIETTREETIGAVRWVWITTPWGETIAVRAVVHWLTPLGTQAVRVGLRFVNPSIAVGVVVARVAELFPTRLFDEPKRTKGASGREREPLECPATCRSRSAANVGRTQQDTLSGLSEEPVNLRDFNVSVRTT